MLEAPKPVAIHPLWARLYLPAAKHKSINS